MATTTKGINYILHHHSLELGSRTRIKDISRIATYCKNGIGGKLLVRIDEKGDFQPVGNITDDFENEINKDLRGHTFEFKFQGISKISTEIIGVDIIGPDISESIKQ